MPDFYYQRPKFSFDTLFIKIRHFAKSSCPPTVCAQVKTNLFQVGCPKKNASSWRLNVLMFSLLNFVMKIYSFEAVVCLQIEGYYTAGYEGKFIFLQKKIYEVSIRPPSAKSILKISLFKNR